MKGPRMSKRQEMQRFLRYYREQTGERELDMRRVAEFAKRMGWRMPTPPSAIDLLAKQFTAALGLYERLVRGDKLRRHDREAVPSLSRRSCRKRPAQPIRLRRYRRGDTQPNAQVLRQSPRADGK